MRINSKARRTVMAGSIALVALAAGCAPKPEAQREPATSNGVLIPDSIVLERGVCFGFCPAYRLRIAASGAIRFEPRNPPGAAETDSISPAAFVELAREAQNVNLESYPDKIQEDERLCGLQATDHPSAAIAVFRAERSKRIDDYLGCHGSPNDPQSEERLRKLRAFEAFVDSVAGTSRWTSRTNRAPR